MQREIFKKVIESQMQIRINPKTNQKLLQHYPDDPYSNLSIITQKRRLNLQLAYLTIDSTFFAKIDPDTRQINLSHLNEQPLLRVIRSLYGQKLIANTIAELSELYKIIQSLQIDDYKANIEKEISSKPHILESLEFLQFSFANNILVDKVIESHIENKLKLLQSNRNYLQLNKITVYTFQSLVQKFIAKMIQKYGSIQSLLSKPQAQIVNHVMENYFNRNNIKAVNYFKQGNGNCADMEIIWGKYHHTFAFSNPIQKPQIGASIANLSQNSSQFLSFKSIQEKVKKKSQEFINLNLNHLGPKSPKSPSSSSTSDLQSKHLKVQELQKQLKQRDSIIVQLQKQIAQLKQTSEKPAAKLSKRLSGPSNGQNLPLVIDDEDFMKSSAQQSLSFLPNIKKTRKSKEYDQDDDFAVSSVFEPAFNGNRRLPEMKEVRTMKKVAGGVKNKFLPN